MVSAKDVVAMQAIGTHGHVGAGSASDDRGYDDCGTATNRALQLEETS